jgi:CRISPR/Cas system-associated endoribonuclease Cas2
MIVLVTYDLKKTGHDYKPFFEALKNQGNWWHYLAATWLIDTKKEPQEISKALHPFMDDNDNLFIVEITNNNAGFLSKKAWAWLNRHETNEN